MLIAAGAVLLLAWLVTRLFTPAGGEFLHVLLLAGLTLALLGVLKGREAAEERARGERKNV